MVEGAPVLTAAETADTVAEAVARVAGTVTDVPASVAGVCVADDDNTETAAAVGLPEVVADPAASFERDDPQAASSARNAVPTADRARVRRTSRTLPKPSLRRGASSRSA